MKTISSRKKHIAPAVLGAAISGGVSLLSSGIGLLSGKSAQAKQRQQLARQAAAALDNQYLTQKREDALRYNEFDEEGQSDVRYYAKGGSLTAKPMPTITTQGLSMMQGKSNGGYETQGGALIPIGDGVEEAVGNRHNESKIDGVSGIQLSQQGEPVAEIENKEVLVDGHKVMSHQMKRPDGYSYADMMRKITAKRNKLETQQEKAKGHRSKNTIERKLASLNMAEETLFAEQEAHKLAIGQQTLENIDNVPSFKTGGYLTNRPTPNPINPALAQYLKRTKGMIPIPFQDANSTINTINDAAANNTSINSIENAVNNVNPVVTAASSSPDKVTADPNNIKTDTEGEGILGSNAVSVAGKLAPLLLDNLGNALLTKGTPNLPTPLLNTATPLKTRLNVNPQLAEVRRGVKAATTNILNNTSNSNNAKNNIIAASLAGSTQASAILGQKENAETQLENADIQNRQTTAMQNTATMNQHAMNQYQRSNDIRTQLSANLANLQGDIKTAMQMDALEENFEGYTLANLSDDDLGSKAALYIGNKKFMSNPAYRQSIISRGKALETQGQPGVANLLRQYGYL